MPKNENHFVPHTYLKAFKSACRRIHLYNLKRSLAKEHVSLKQQCRKHKFYGPTQNTEDALCDLENHIGPVLHDIAATKTLSPIGTEAYAILLGFVALQILRTPSAANRVNMLTDKMMKEAYSRDPRFAGEIETLELAYENAVLMSLKNLPFAIDSISDLHAHLIASPTNSFFTSDNPAFKYNLYCEKIQYMGTTGLLSRGFQIFLPLTPRFHLMFYDPVVYRVPSVRLSMATPSDVDVLNGMQIVSADENVYFSDWNQLQRIRQSDARFRRHRKSDPIAVRETGQDDDPNRSLLHAFERTPYLKLELSFLSVNRRARRVPLEDRAVYRKEISMPQLPEPPHLQGRRITFSRFIGER